MTSVSMVASAHRISRGSDFARTLKSGVRVSTRDLVLHVLDLRPTDRVHVDDRHVTTVGGPWLGLIVSKSIGNAVTRHQAARRLRAAFRSTLDECPSDQAMVVIRPRRGVVEHDSVELARQLRSAYRKPALSASSVAAVSTAPLPDTADVVSSP